MNTNINIGIENNFYEIPEYSVSEISRCLKNVVEDNFNLVKVKGEISGYKSAASGHAYFNLKDDRAVIKAIGWRDLISKVSFKLEDGLEVIATGRISTYEGQSTYQIVISKVELAGVGALLALLEKRKIQLAAEGLFDPARKRAIPFLPKTIGIITSPTGAVIKDILHRINDRIGLHVLIWPVLVQGELAASQIATAIDGFNNLPPTIPKPDVLIVARGGGSIEDLWAFNEEIVVRAAANSTIPLISAIGHETDTTLIDFASDIRAPTPTAAAEMATPVKADLLAMLEVYSQRLKLTLPSILNNVENKLSKSLTSLINFSQKLSEFENKLTQFNYKLEQSLLKCMSAKSYEFKLINSNFSANLILRQLALYETKLLPTLKFLHNHIINILTYLDNNLNSLDRLLESFNYTKTLERGFIFAKDENGNIIKSKQLAETMNDFSLIFSDGDLKVRPAMISAPKKTKLTHFNITQNSLFD